MAPARTPARAGSQSPGRSRRNRGAKSRHQHQQAEAVRLRDRAEIDRVGEQAVERHGGNRGVRPPFRNRETLQFVPRQKRHGTPGRKGRHHMGQPPTHAEHPEPGGIPIRVQRRLRKDEIEIGPSAGADQLRGEQMEALIPVERPRLRVGQQHGCQQSKRAAL